MAKKIISAVIPCRNQGDKIGVTIDHIKKTAGKLKDYEVEIVFVNDRSTDNSVAEAEKHLAGYKHKQILHTDEKYIGNGKGLAVELGMTKAKGDYRLFMDADNSTKFEEIEKLIPYFDKYDIVLGTRYSNTVVVPTGNWFKAFWNALVDVVQVIIYGHAKRYTAKMMQGRLRELVSRGGNLAFTVLLGQSFTDSRCGFKMYSKEASNKIFPQCRIKTWDFDSEALVLAKKYKYKMVEVPVVWYDDAGASNFKPKDMINAFVAIFKIRYNQLVGRYTNKEGKRSFPALLWLFLVIGLGLLGFIFFYLTSCDFAREIKYYAAGKTKTYYYGRRTCPQLWGIKEIDLKDIEKLPDDQKIEVLTPRKNEELQSSLEKKFQGVNRYTATDGKSEFLIYEVICQTCNQK